MKSVSQQQQPSAPTAMQLLENTCALFEAYAHWTGWLICSRAHDGHEEKHPIHHAGKINPFLTSRGAFSRSALHDSVPTLGPDIDGAVRRISTEYNERGLRETITSWDNASTGAGTVVNQVGQQYDAFNQLITDQQEHSGAIDGSTPEVNYGFTDGSNNTLRATSVTTPSGSQTDSAYGTANGIDDIFNRVASLKVNGETDNLAEYTYAGLSMVATVKYPTPDAELSFVKQAGAMGTGDAGDSLTGYDRFGRIIDMPWRNATSAEVLAQVQYGYDAASRRTWRQDLTPASNHEHDRFYQYDELGQVESADVGTLNQNRTGIGGISSQTESWKYDETGNWQRYQKGEDGVSTIDETRTNNVSNQITTIDGSSSGIAHDLNGNTTLLATGDGLQGPPRKLIWDAWNRLIEVRNENDNSLVGKYAYDGLFRRTTRELNDGTVFHSYYNSDWRSVEERKGTSTDPVEIFYWGARSRWDLVRRDRDSNGNGTLDETLFCLMDALDPIAVVDDFGGVQERFEYTAFGVNSILAPNYSNRAGSDFDWNFLFHGEFLDSESGFYNYGFRFYDVKFGRWTSRDPIDEIGGLNLFSFVNLDPVNRKDKIGLNQCPCGSLVDDRCCGGERMGPRDKCCGGQRVSRNSPGAGGGRNLHRLCSCLERGCRWGLFWEKYFASLHDCIWDNSQAGRILRPAGLVGGGLDRAVESGFIKGRGAGVVGGIGKGLWAAAIIDWMASAGQCGGGVCICDE